MPGAADESRRLTADDHRAIAELAARYAAAVDDCDFEALRRVFTADAVLDTGRGVRTGIEEIVAAMQRLHRYEATGHLVGLPLVVDTREGATMRTPCRAHHLELRDGRRVDHLMQITYHDRIVATEHGWRIAHRRLAVAWSAEHDLDPG